MFDSLRLLDAFAGPAAGAAWRRFVVEAVASLPVDRLAHQDQLFDACRFCNLNPSVDDEKDGMVLILVRVERIAAKENEIEVARRRRRSSLIMTVNLAIDLIVVAMSCEVVLVGML